MTTIASSQKWDALFKRDETKSASMARKKKMAGLEINIAQPC
ncbi:MAG: hypothetical protein RPR97_04665 [Colwellia sp.]